MNPVKYDVQCPRDPWKVYKMEIQLFRTPEGVLIPSPCNGCDNCNGHEACSICVETLTKLSINDPTLDSYPKPISPLKYR